MTVTESLVVERVGGIVTVILNRPEKRNAIDPCMWEGLRTCFEDIGHRPEDRCVIFTGAGRDFSSGADLLAGRSVASPLGWMHLVHAAILALHRLPQPSIAKVRGIAVGAGMTLALHCDLVLANEEARLGQPFLQRALSPDCGATWLLPRLLGLRKAKELALLGRWVSADEGVSLGLVNRVVPDADLDSTVADWARQLATGPPDTLRLTKSLLDNSFEVTVEQALQNEALAQALNLHSPDFREALQAFQEKREPVFGATSSSSALQRHDPNPIGDT